MIVVPLVSCCVISASLDPVTRYCATGVAALFGSKITAFVIDDDVPMTLPVEEKPTPNLHQPNRQTIAAVPDIDNNSHLSPHIAGVHSLEPIRASCL